MVSFKRSECRLPSGRLLRNLRRSMQETTLHFLFARKIKKFSQRIQSRRVLAKSFFPGLSRERCVLSFYYDFNHLLTISRESQVGNGKGSQLTNRTDNAGRITCRRALQNWQSSSCLP